MIRKCMDCKKLMGVKMPWISMEVTMGICAPCSNARLEKFRPDERTCFLVPIGRVRARKTKRIYMVRKGVSA